jgi:hypothetical protein
VHRSQPVLEILCYGEPFILDVAARGSVEHCC